jgi:topoisomerase-4 subunit A
VKGFKALGNQLTTDKIKQVNILESLPYEVPEEIVLERRSTNDDGTDFQRDEDGQIILFYFRYKKSHHGAFMSILFIFSF